MFIILSFLLTLFYIAIQTKYINSWNALPSWNIPKGFVPATKVSILIPVRNEDDNIEACIAAIYNQSYPKTLFEVIIIDDFSEDKTPEVINDLIINKGFNNLKLVQLADYIREDEIQSFKKKAIEIGVKKSIGDLIISTDGDCFVQEDWLMLMISLYEVKSAKFIAAPVNFYKEKNDFERFQSLDFIGMMGITGAGIYSKIMRMCNGANMAYPKAVFNHVNGFIGIDKSASGDDMMLLHKIARAYPNDIYFLKNEKATVFTRAKETLKDFVNQRVRWSTKSSNYEERQVTFILAGVWLFCLSIPLNLLFAIFFGWQLLVIVAVQFLSKLIVDYRLLKSTSTYFNRSDLMKTFFKSSIYHLCYIVAVGFLGGILKKYEWKGRTVQ